MKASDILIAVGWLPSPSSDGPYWENVAFSRLIEPFHSSNGYKKNEVRWDEPCALAIATSMLALAETCILVPRTVIAGQLV